jgi:hypothetical protein
MPSRNLQVHHINYSNLGHEEYNDLIVVCDKCHKMLHEKNPNIKKITHRWHDKVRSYALFLVHAGYSEREAFRSATNVYDDEFDDKIKSLEDCINDVLQESKMLDKIAENEGYDIVVTGV